MGLGPSLPSPFSAPTRLSASSALGKGGVVPQLPSSPAPQAPLGLGREFRNPQSTIPTKTKEGGPKSALLVNPRWSLD